MLFHYMLRPMPKSLRPYLRKDNEDEHGNRDAFHQRCHPSMDRVAMSAPVIFIPGVHPDKKTPDTDDTKTAKDVPRCLSQGAACKSFGSENKKNADKKNCQRHTAPI
ncbi:MAG: hypothetical protein IJD81_03435 [Oscillospiraceae bacterium]|nr:hypothetical protein [Oscillospiraceae bacterium]